LWNNVRYKNEFLNRYFLFFQSIRDCAADLIRDISDVAFDELVKYKIYENTNNNQITNGDEQMIQSLNEQQDEYSNLVKNSLNKYLLFKIEDFILV